MTFAYRLPDVVPVDCHGCRPFCNEVCEACPGPKAKPRDARTIAPDTLKTTAPDNAQDAAESLEEGKDDG